MPISRLAARPVATLPKAALPAAIDAAVKRAEAVLRRLDKDHDGALNEAEIKPLMKRLNAATDQMERQQDAGTNPTDLRKSLARARGAMTEQARTLLTIAQAMSRISGDPDTVSLSVLKQNVRAVYDDSVKALQKTDGGLINGLGALFSAVLLPEPVLRAALPPR